MLMPSIYERDLFDDFFEDFARPVRYAVKRSCVPAGTMKTDIQENENGYEIAMELPGYKKENVKAELNDGYLTVTASTESNTAENNEENKEENKNSNRYIRKERFYGECRRSFYVGEDLESEDITAKFEDGILKLTVPKKSPKPEVEKNKFIQIAG